MTRIGPTVPGGTRTQIASTVTRAIAVGNGARLAWHWRRENEFRRLNPPAVPGTDDEREAAERDRKSFERFTAEVAEAFLDSIRIARDAIASAEPDPRVRIEVVRCMAIALHPYTDGLVRTEPASPDQLARIEEWHRLLEAAAAARELAKEEWSRTTGSRRVSR